MGGNDTDDDPQAPALATDNEAEGSGAAGNPMQPLQVILDTSHGTTITESLDERRDGFKAELERFFLLKRDS